MNGTILRSVAAAAVGMAVAFALIWLAQYAGSELSPNVYDPASGEILIPAGATAALLVGWFIGTFAGGWLAMRVSGGAGPGWIVAGAVIGASVYRAVTLADSSWIIALGILIPLAAMGAAQRAVNMAAN
ncbi:MAG: hypothetical protein CVT74_12505 [Alphaproteobacteria bacterium HGW-Alphaproteobacteria-13]|nr:MAG: hypothetical protein CVT74_12505 [Alphaproteobacteria bacterium HGW-Alphaproteobacteria-13]